jgi:cell division protein FtsZ
MRNQGLAHMGIGRAKSENRIIEAVRQAVSSPLLETTIEGAKSVILNVTGGRDLMLTEVNEAAVLVQGIIDSGANIIFGATIDDSMSDEVKVTIIATGFTAESEGEEKITTITNPKPEVVAEPEPQPEEVKPVDPEVVKMEEALYTVPEDKKSRDLPPFMKKLFKK